MKETDDQLRSSHTPDFYAANDFLHAPQTQEILLQHNARILSYYQSRDLDFGFYTTDHEPTLVPMNFYGVDSCVGLCVPRPGEEQKAFERRVDTVNGLLHQVPEYADATVIAVTLDAIARLQNEREAPPVKESNGNGKMNGSNEQKNGNGESLLERRLHELITKTENTTVLYDLGIAIAPHKGKLDILFVDAENGHERPEKAARLVNIQNLRVARTRKVGAVDDRGKITKQDVFDEQLIAEGMCAGIYIPDVAAIEKDILGDFPNLAEYPQELRIEVKKRAYSVAEHIRRSLVRYEPETDHQGFYIAVALEGQLSLWERSGFLRDVSPFREGAITPREVINALFYDANGHREGPLSQLGMSFNTRGVTVQGLDLEFYSKDADGIKHTRPLSLWGYGNDLKTLAPYDNVVGMICFEEGVSLADRKRHTRAMERLYGQWKNMTNAKIVGVDRNLLALWDKQGGPLVPEPEQKKAHENWPPKKQVDYGFLPQDTPFYKALITLYENREQIGGNKLKVSLRYPGDIVRDMWLDFGWAYGDDPALSRFPNRASYEMGIAPYLEDGIMPEAQRFFRTDLLERSLSYASVLAALEEDGHSFIVSELYHRLRWDGLREHILAIDPSFAEFDRLKQNLDFIEQTGYHEKIICDLLWLSHAHEDHYGLLFAVRDEIPFGMTPETALFLQGRFHSGWHYTNQEAVIRRVREAGKEGNSYPLYTRPVVLFADGQTRRVGPDVDLTAYYVNHSIQAAAAGINLLDPLGNTRAGIAYTGDINSGPLTERAVQFLSDSTVLIIEGTNVFAKPGEAITHERVANNLEKLRKEADGKGGMYIVQIAPNNLHRLQMIIGISGRRKVCVSFSIAQTLHEYAILNERLPEDQRIPVPELGEDVLIFKSPKGSYKPWERQLEQTYGVVTITDVMKDQTGYAVVVPPRKLLSTILGNLHGMARGVFVRSCTWPFDSGEKDSVISNSNFAKRQRFAFYADLEVHGGKIWRKDFPMGLHASGHTTLEDLLDIIATIHNGGNLQLVMPLHGLNRGRYARIIRNYLVQQGIAQFTEEGFIGPNIISKVTKGAYTVEIPLSG